MQCRIKLVCIWTMVLSIIFFFRITISKCLIVVDKRGDLDWLGPKRNSKVCTYICVTCSIMTQNVSWMGCVSNSGNVSLILYFFVTCSTNLCKSILPVWVKHEIKETKSGEHSWYICDKMNIVRFSFMTQIVLLIGYVSNWMHCTGV